MANKKKILKIFQRTERTSWILVGGALGIAFGILLSFVNNIGITVSVVAGIVLSMAITQLGETVRSDEIDEIISVFNNMRHDKFLRKKIDEFVDYYFYIKEYRNPLFDEHAKDTINTFLDKLSILSDGRLDLMSHEETTIGYFLVRNVTETIKASSLSTADSPEWWNSPEGKGYLEENIALIKRGGVVTRIFLLHENQLEELKTIMFSQAKQDINVYVGIMERLPAHLINSYAIFDDSIVRDENAQSGYEVASVVHIKNKIVRQYIRYFEDLLLRSHKIDEFFSTDTHNAL